MRPSTLFIAAILAVLTSPALAQDVSAAIAEQLKAQGYSDIDVSRTWLGRARIVGENDAQRREIVVNPRTGEILRDVVTSSDGAPQVPQILGSDPARPSRPAAPEGGVDRSAAPGAGAPETRGGPGPGAGSAGPGNGPHGTSGGPSR